MNRMTRGIVLSLSLAVLVYVGVGFVLGKTNDDKAYRALSVFSSVLQHIQNDYVEDPNLPVVTSGAIHGLLESLDPLSSYLNPREYNEYKRNATNGSRGQVGIALSKRFGFAMVVSVLPDSPAQRAGLRPGDFLEKVAGFPTREMSVMQANLLLTGEPGSMVRVAVIRRGRSEPKEVDLQRAPAVQPKLLFTMLKEPDAPAAAGIAYVKVPALQAGASEDLRKVLAQLEKQGAHKLILDLRDTALGPVSEGVAAAKLFLASGKIATLRGQTVPAVEHTAEPARQVWKLPVSVLTSTSTYGAAEVLAAAIAESGRGEAIGERTFGSASEQKIIPLEDGAALLLTVANYFGPAGKNISEEGVKPGIEVARAAEDAAAAVDDDEVPAAPEPDEISTTEDNVLKRAIELMAAPGNAAPGEKKAAGKPTAWRAPQHRPDEFRPAA